MRHDLRLEGPAFRLRPVELSDAAEILRLRSDPSRSRFIHTTAPSVEAQERWLTDYFARDGDLYWAVERHDGDVEGFVGIYDIDGPTAEWGRWVLRTGSLAAPESAWLVHEAGFTLLALDSLVTRTLVENRPVVAFHARYGAEVVRTIPGYARISDEVHDAVEARMTAQRWATAGPRLMTMAERAAGLLRRTAPRLHAV
ncbi:GNAT family N-acetyltransferase [Geodermatophilus sp. SYSU D00965]